LGLSCEVLGRWRGDALAGEPGRSASLAYERPFGGEAAAVLADYVTAEDGTGVVHTAPGHGADDFITGQRYGLEPACPVDASGRFTAEAGAGLEGKAILSEGNEAVAANLAERGWLLKRSEIRHSYPHCWRCKNPVVFRATEQWFLKIDHRDLRQRLLAAVDSVQWLPEEGRRRIAAMVANRPDWCLSRQRVWGTPIPVLYCAGCRKPVTEDAVLAAVEREVAQRGDGFWFADWGREVTARSWPFLGKPRCPCGGESFLRERDVLDVWMDSGASWLAVLEPRGQAPCQLYLEGSDQHRGWFQSSLVLSVALRGRAPYEGVLTHGFVLDEKGRAMHKSAGNVVSPQKVIDSVGADVLRLWAALADYSEDVRISDKLLAGPAEGYRRLRNTLRYLLGNTSDFDPAEDAVEFSRLPELERFMLHRLSQLQSLVLGDYERYEFRSAARRLLDFCSFDLSAFYCDVLKDRLYAFPKADEARRAAQTVLAESLRRLLQLAAPVVSFTAEEAWQQGPRRWGAEESVFLARLPPADWK
ncbi:MAG: class I tRNA ligase family protein, partial [Elusimicrobia bacterium]|nr:class I tRNA ligase family protein [Elusimicrobiota bacterium]